MRIENKNIKVLIAGGCSFTQIPNYLYTEDYRKIVPKYIRHSNKSDPRVRCNWPIYLSLAINCSSIFEGRGACGNV